VCEYPVLPTPIDTTRAPPFDQMNEHPKRFERMSAQLMSREPTLKSAHLFSIGGTNQFGIDIIGDRKDNNGCEVGSCKCYPRTTASQLRDWSDEFFDHWETRWKVERVRRFILITAATNITSVEILDRRKTETARFAVLGVEYEIWGPEELTQRLQNDRPTVQRFLSPVWASLLCGPPVPDHIVDLNALAVEQLQRVQSTLSEHVAARIIYGREQLRVGDYDRVERVLGEVRAANTWSQLARDVQASTLRLAGSLAIQQRNLSGARELAEAAHAISPSEPRLAAIIAAVEAGPVAGLDVLGKPITREGHQTQAALLLDKEDVTTAAAVVEGLIEEDPDDPESLRLLAYTRVLQGRREEALKAAVRAETLAPAWLSVIHAAAIVRYGSALSPISDLTMAVHPNPIASELVKKDDVSKTALEKALAGFEKLLTKPFPADDVTIWKLACLANLPDRAVDAQNYCQTLLKASPLSIEAVAWALTRSFAFDRAASRTALADRYARGKASGTQIRVYIWLLSEDEGSEAAAAILEQNLDVQEGESRAEASEWIRRLRGQTVPPVDGREPRTPPGELEKALRYAAEKEDWSEVEDQLHRLLGDRVPNPVGLLFASAVASRGRWTALAPYVDAICNFATADAVRLAAHIVYHTQDAPNALSFLNEHKTVFPRSELPIELRRIEVWATAEQGDLSAALRLGERLAAETQLTSDRLHVAHLHLASGHAQASIPIVRQALTAGELGSHDAIRFSVAITREDVNLAGALWRYAMNEGVPDSLLLHALSQGFKLGLDNETGPLMPRLHQRAIGGAADVWLGTVDDVVEHIRTHREHGHHVLAHLEAGAIPVHFLPVALNASLAWIYQLDRPARDQGSLGTLFLRHGARPIEVLPEALWRDWQVHLDITGLMIADQLNLLDEVEGLAKPVIVSRYLPDALYKLEQDASHQQMSRAAAGRAIMKARARGDLSLADGPADEARTVRHDRLRADVAEPGPTLRSIAAALAHLGETDAPTAEASEENVLQREDEGLAIAPAANDRLVFVDNTLETLAADGLLEPALRRFRCEIPNQDYQRVVSEVAAAEAGDALADRIRELRGRVARGLEQERYVFAPERNCSLPKGERNDRKGSTPIEESLLDLMVAPTVRNGVVWVDDRYVSGFVNAGGNLIVGVVEVLNALAASGRLTAEQRRLKLLQLREGGAAFIPLTPEEVVPPLKAAHIDENGVIVETKTLITLRRNFAAALRFDPKLKIGEGKYPALHGRPDESPFFHASRQLLGQCLIAVWGDADACIDACRVRSNWLWASLRVEQYVRPLPVDDPGSGAEMLASLLLAGLFANALSIVIGSRTESDERRKAYLAWIKETILTPHGPAEARFLDIVATHLKGLLRAILDKDGLTADQATQVRYLLHTHVQMLPPELAHRLLDDPTFATNIAMQNVASVVISGTDFKADTFWRACGRALRLGKATAQSTAGKRVRMTSAAGEIVMSGAVDARLYQGFFPALRATRDERIREIEAFLDRLDLPSYEREVFAQKAHRARGEGPMVQALHEAHEASVITTYEKIASAFRARDNISVAIFLPPPAKRLLHHLRLDGSDGPFAARVGAAWKELRARIGPCFAFRRLAGLPVRFADLVEANAADPAADLAALGKPATPMTRLHVARAARDLGQTAVVEREIVELIDRVTSEGELFATLLSWSEKAFQSDEEWHRLTTADQLALIWSHADRVTGLLVEHGVDFKYAIKFFADHYPDRSMGQVLHRRRALDQDCAAPESLYAPALLYHGLAYVFGADDAYKGIPEGLRGALAAIMVARDGEELKLNPALIVRSDLALNSMGSFLADRPVGLFEPKVDPALIRDPGIKAAIVAVEAAPNDPRAWTWVSLLGGPILAPQQAARLDAVFEQTILWAFKDSEVGLKGCRVAVDTRLRLGSELSDEPLMRKLHALAVECAGAFPAPFEPNDDSEAANAFSNLLETIAAAARAETPVASLDRLHRLAMLVAETWPAAAPALRGIFDTLVRQTPPRDRGQLWRTFVSLRSWP
jgi:tetratricopeptide (TPR) repeat protein